MDDKKINILTNILIFNTIIIYSIIIIFFIVSFIQLNEYKKCKNIDFSSNYCEKYKKY